MEERKGKTMLNWPVTMIEPCYAAASPEAGAPIYAFVKQGETTGALDYATG